VEIEAYRPFFILGEVAAPGQYPYVPNMTVESAVAIAGGFSPRARRDSVTVTHTDASGTARFVVPPGSPMATPQSRTCRDIQPAHVMDIGRPHLR
jgi:polysaccharide biosynthesis/export protein